MGGPIDDDGVAALLPAVAAVSMSGHAEAPAVHPGERPLIAGAVDNRRREFAAGRACARLAAARLGVEMGPLLRGGRREPLWPRPVIGSITHTDGFVAAVVRRRGNADEGVGEGVGIDAEHVGRVGDELYSRLFTSDERAWLAELDAESRERWATVLFSAKEAFYKAQFPLTGSWVGFADVAADAPDRDRLGSVVLRPASSLSALDAVSWPVVGRWLRRRSIVVAAVEVDRQVRG